MEKLIINPDELELMTDKMQYLENVLSDLINSVNFYDVANDNDINFTSAKKLIRQ